MQGAHIAETGDEMFSGIGILSSNGALQSWRELESVYSLSVQQYDKIQ